MGAMVVFFSGGPGAGTKSSHCLLASRAGGRKSPHKPDLVNRQGVLFVVSFCFFFFVNNVAPVVPEPTGNKGILRIENGLVPGYGFPGCNPDCQAPRHRPLRGDWMHPGPTFAGSIPDSLMGRWLRPSASLV